MITDGLGRSNRMVEEEFGISDTIIILLSSLKRIFMCIRKTFMFDSPGKLSTFVSKSKRDGL